MPCEPSDPSDPSDSGCRVNRPIPLNRHAVWTVAGVGRFSLTRSLLAPKAKTALAQLFERLQAAAAKGPSALGCAPGELDALRSKWL
eukprot:8939299-Pyramimonas_sp.AAC.1